MFAFALQRKWIKQTRCDLLNWVSGKVNIGYLTTAEIAQIEDCIPLLPIHQIKIAQLFLFSCYTGLRYLDANNLKAAKVMQMEGKDYLDYRKIKRANRKFYRYCPRQ